MFAQIILSQYGYGLVACFGFVLEHGVKLVLKPILTVAAAVVCDHGIWHRTNEHSHLFSHGGASRNAPCAIQCTEPNQNYYQKLRNEPELFHK
ncbi:MAG: hypothetical protein LAN64_17965 [Acidobacteriia bacterium]|nr:hypothetical protein [Terriglobia bacterium]